MAWVVASNLMALFTAMVIGLALPRFTSYETYAGYREYTLFIGFSGLLHFGFVNGIALRYGGLGYEELPKDRFGAYARFLALMELAVTAVLLPVCLIVSGGRITPLFFVIINLFLENFHLFFANLAAFTGRFRLDAILQLFYRAALLIGFILILIKEPESWMGFLILTTVLNALVLVLYAFFNASLIFGPAGKISDLREDIAETVKRGMLVLLGEQLSVLILGADSIFARVFFDVKQFSLYSFAVYIVVTAFTIINAANAVIFPYLKRQDERDIKKRYASLKRISLALSAFMTALIFLCPFAIRIFLPGYEDSIPFLLILAPTLVFRTLQGMACSNTMKALDMEKEYFKCNLTIGILALLSDTVAYLVFRDLRSIAAASVLVFAIWFFLCDRKIARRSEGSHTVSS